MDESEGLFGIPTATHRLRRMSENVSALEIDHKVPAVMYFRSGMQMVRMADMYLKQGSLKDAYLLYIRFMTLFLEKIRQHPGWALMSIQDRKLAAEKVKEILPKTERLKDLLQKSFEEDYQRKVAAKLEEERQRQNIAEEQARREQLAREAQTQLAQNLDESGGSTAPLVSSVVTDPVRPLDSISYPDTNGSSLPDNHIPTPSAPSLEPESNAHSSNGTVSSNGSSLPTFDRSTKPASLLSLSTRSNHGLRNVVVPSLLVEKFLVLAHSTTLKNIETCGILAGHLDQNQLVITHLIVPKQHASADSCTTLNEEEVFHYQDKHNLITLGWIHTHPSQTAFLSSVDMHTHCSYQLMMPEAIAIVCAPRYFDNSIFCLTQNYGMEHISKCSRTGFHPHPIEPPLYVIAEHARLESDLPVEVFDLREQEF